MMNCTGNSLESGVTARQTSFKDDIRVRGFACGVDAFAKLVV